MSRDYFIINASRVVYAPGHDTAEDALSIAQNACRREKGKTFTVVKVVDSFCSPKEPKEKK